LPFFSLRVFSLRVFLQQLSSLLVPRNFSFNLSLSSVWPRRDYIAI
jgi:hypothetical protein